MQTDIDIVSATPTITSGSAYAAGNLLGNLLVFNKAVRYGRTARINSVIVSDKGNQKAAMDLILFRQQPSNTTLTDKSALAVDPADLVNIIAVLPVLTTSYAAFNANAVAYLGDLRRPVQIDGDVDTLWGLLVCRGTPTYVSTSDLQVSLGLERWRHG